MTTPANTYSLHRYRKLILPAVITSALVYASAIGCEVSFDQLGKGMSVAGVLLASFFPPEWESIGEMSYAALETLFLAVIATPLAVIVSFIAALLSAKNVTPGLPRALARFGLASERALPDIIVAFFFVAAFGVGPMAGIIALTLGSVGMLGKLFADAMEEIDPKLLEGLACTGAGQLHILRYGILPTVLPSVIANSLFRFEINIRSAALLGMVGAGGIGYELSQAMALLDYPRASVAIAVTLALIFATERLSEALRHKLMQSARTAE